MKNYLEKLTMRIRIKNHIILGKIRLQQVTESLEINKQLQRDRENDKIEEFKLIVMLSD